jgi:MFS family permease
MFRKSEKNYPDKGIGYFLSVAGFSCIIFLTYASVFAFRKAYTAAGFTSVSFPGISYLTALIIAQIIGYMISKFMGIKFISELPSGKRWKMSVLLLGLAWFSLFVFAWSSPWVGLFCMLLNGFVLGFMWGIVFSYAEGRRSTDFIGVVLAVSFLFAGGFSRTVGKWLMNEWSVSEKWMPFTVAGLFVLPLTFFYYLLERYPPPGEEDIRTRTLRRPMALQDRTDFKRKFGAGLAAVVVLYLLLTILRDLRDNYMVKMWNELGYEQNVAVYTQTETISSIVILVLIGCLVFVKNHSTALHFIHALLFMGLLLAVFSSVFYRQNIISGASWMQWNGMGLYLSYILFNSVYFERLLAVFRVAGNVGFLIYTADAWGYLGSVGVMLSKQFLPETISWVHYYLQFSIWFSVAGMLAALFSWVYFNQKKKEQDKVLSDNPF